MTDQDATEINRAWWDHLAGLHGDDDYYDVPGFLDGGSSLDEREWAEVTAAVGQVSGMTLLHLQCHIGLDTLSFARKGAVVTGIDYSTTAIRRARELAAAAGLPATFRLADVQDLPTDLHGRFDLVFASYGIFYWIEKPLSWMRSAAAALRPGGGLVIVETHPLLQMFRSGDPAVAVFPYGGGQPQRRPVGSTYAGVSLPPARSMTVGFAHGIGEMVTAAAESGFRIDTVTEYLDRATPELGAPETLTRGSDGRYRLVVGGQALPVAYGIRATKPGTGHADREHPPAPG
ncbi:bifunctional 2-polyprenyl-6-hydroxyphenol methylase/3-demethylubiquinol 3-O-methyltransferase UbiG [Amycolatopsis sp. EV170708-02-1]|uniref:class I SAM-dependent methyltransferase n=1 Tax=Amycolatopsis sp. EV170708-02-1 TaxID=2919322 RepID=UPI001F0B83E8|nr:class I SAM-dependent methyltransferase [Amycolatopsis sp. EV170708-02-1]UMP04100.1 class I SAM-dependent methyltransferase [Amycolatopsis sp. EV170708-02-1]